MIDRSPSGLSLVRTLPFGKGAAVFFAYAGRIPVGHWIRTKLILKKPLQAYKTTTTSRHPLRIKLCRKRFRQSSL